MWVFFSSRDDDKKNHDLSERIKKLLFSRGPDEQKTLNLNIGSFVFARLAIIDLNERSSQPMVSNDKNTFIMNNGEIYNYLEIRKNYLNDIKLNSEGDTEVF